MRHWMEKFTEIPPRLFIKLVMEDVPIETGYITNMIAILTYSQLGKNAFKQITHKEINKKKRTYSDLTFLD